MTGELADWALLALGGALGGVARFWISGVIARRFGETFPWGTLAVNVSGAAAIGVVGGLLLFSAEVREPQDPRLWAALVIGALGSYTTVSSFSWQTLALARTGEFGRAALNVAASLLLCLGAAAAGNAATVAVLAGAGP